jgi:hypothetical protein
MITSTTRSSSRVKPKPLGLAEKNEAFLTPDPSQFQ